MSIKRDNVGINCRQCEFTSSNGGGSFYVTVPVDDAASGIAGLAELHCTVTSELHTVELTKWHDEQGQIIKPPAELRHRLLKALDFVAERRICGNQHLCPTEVVRVVEEATGS